MAEAFSNIRSQSAEDFASSVTEDYSLQSQIAKEAALCSASGIINDLDQDNNGCAGDERVEDLCIDVACKLSELLLISNVGRRKDIYLDKSNGTDYENRTEVNW